MIRRILLSVSLCAAALMSACSDSPSPATAAHGESAAEAAAKADFERGPHRGRLLRDGDLALELQIFEDGVPPEFHVYLYRKDQPLPPTAATVSVALTRLGGRVDRFSFAPQGDYLLGSGTVVEPHSFSVAVSAAVDGETHEWAFDSFEGRVTIPTAIAKDAGIAVDVAGPATIADTLTLRGRVLPDAERVSRIGARYPGLIRSVARSAGDTVSAGDTLAVIESSDSLQPYSLKAPGAGVIMERRANPGEMTDDGPLFVIADYRSLWVDLPLFPQDLARVKVGQSVRLRSTGAALEAEGRVQRIAPLDGDGQVPSGGVFNARVVLDNADGTWLPGMFVDAVVQVGEYPVPLAVRRSGLQGFRDFTVVFEQVDETYEVRMLELGRQDETWVEVLGGLAPGARYVSANSYLIKADIEKSGASHDH